MVHVGNAKEFAWRGAVHAFLDGRSGEKGQRKGQ